MKTLLIFAFSVLTLTAQAGVCRLTVSSNESGKIPFAGAATPEKIQRVSLDECIRFSQEKLGTKVLMTTMIRRERRLITDVRFEYSDSEINMSGKMKLKSSH